MFSKIERVYFTEPIVSLEEAVIAMRNHRVSGGYGLSILDHIIKDSKSGCVKEVKKIKFKQSFIMEMVCNVVEDIDRETMKKHIDMTHENYKHLEDFPYEWIKEIVIL